MGTGKSSNLNRASVSVMPTEGSRAVPESKGRFSCHLEEVARVPQNAVIQRLKGSKSTILAHCVKQRSRHADDSVQPPRCAPLDSGRCVSGSTCTCTCAAPAPAASAPALRLHTPCSCPDRAPRSPGVGQSAQHPVHFALACSPGRHHGTKLRCSTPPQRVARPVMCASTRNTRPPPKAHQCASTAPDDSAGR